MFSRLFGMFMLCVSSALFALSGEFITNEKGMPADKFEIAGKSCIVYVGTFSNTGTYVIQDNYLTITYKVKKLGAEGIPYQQATDVVFKIIGDTSIIGKTEPFTGIKYTKYKPRTNAIESFHDKNAIVPVVPKIYKTHSVQGYNISITETYNKLNAGRNDAYGQISMAQMTAQTIINQYIQQTGGIPFKNYIVDLQMVLFGKIPDTMSLPLPCIYVQGGNMIQKLDMMNTQEEQHKYLLEIGKPYFIYAYSNSHLEKVFDTYSPKIRITYQLVNNSWFYDKIYSSTSNYNPNPIAQDKFESLNIFNDLFLNFVVCDDNWKPKYWFDAIKDWGIMDDLKQCQQWPDSTKKIVYDAYFK
jgi:hypothetical protein